MSRFWILKIPSIHVNSAKFIRNQVLGLFGILLPTLAITSNFDIIYIGGLKYSSDFGLCYSISSQNDIVVMGCDDRSIRILNLKSKIAFKLYIHESRVWKVSVHDGYIISCGEDGVLNITRLSDIQFNIDSLNDVDEIIETRLIKMEPLLQLKGHGSKNIWTFDIKQDTIYTGGADGKIRKYSLKLPRIKELELLKLEKKCFIFKSSLEILVLYGDGRLILHDIEKNTQKLIFSNNEYAKSPIITHNEGIFCIGNNAGQVLVSNFQDFKIYQVLERKVQAVFMTRGSVFVFGGNQFMEMGLNGIELQSKKELNLPSGLVVTAVTRNEEITIVGCRGGELLVYKNDSNSPTIFTDIHQSNAITGIIIKANMIETVGRDGFHCKTNIDTKFTIYRKQITKGWLESINNSQIVGFYNQKLFVYSLKNDCPIASIDCLAGGGSRNYDILQLDDGLKVVLNIGTSLYFYDVPSIGGDILVEGSHSMETRAVTLYNNLIVTVGEDGSCLIHDQYRLVSSIRIGKSLKCLQIVDDLVFFGGSEQELSVWQFVQGTHLVKIDQAARVSSVEFRIMDLSVLKFNDGYIMVTANSDSYLRIWKYSNNAGFELLDENSFHARCVQKAAIFNHQGSIYGCSGATDGVLVIWKLVKHRIHVIERIKCCQSGIKAFDGKLVHNLLSAAVGGDDCSITFVEYNLSENRILTKIQKTIHSSAVTGIKISRNLIISTSMDERLAISAVNDGALELLKSVLLDVPDIGDLAIDFKSNTAIVVGHGMEIIKIPVGIQEEFLREAEASK